MKTLFSLTVLLSLFAAPAMATLQTEGTDASNQLSSARALPGGTTSVIGVIRNVGVNSDVDMYKIELVSGGEFTIEVVELDDPLDMNLIVFNSAGQALAGDDDDNSGCTPVEGLLTSLDSCLTLNLPAGIYYFAVGDNNIGAYTTVQEYLNDESDFFDNDDGILDSPTPEIMVLVGDESGPGSPGDEGRYRVNFSRAISGPGIVPTIPVMPVWMMVVMAGVIGLFARRRLSAKGRQA